MNLTQTTTVELTDGEWAVIEMATRGVYAANQEGQFADIDGVWGLFQKALELALQQLFDADQPCLIAAWMDEPMNKQQFEEWAAFIIERDRSNY